RAHLVVSAMRHLAEELRAADFQVDYRHASTLAAGLDEHRREHRPSRVWAMEPASYDGLAMLRTHDVEVVRSDQFLCHYEDFIAWVGDRRQVKMEDFYRWQRTRLDVLMDGDAPAGGR